MHGTTAKKNVRNRSCSDAEQFVRYGSGEEPFAKEQLVNNTSVQPVEHVLVGFFFSLLKILKSELNTE